jgi:hypothetical protein
MRRISIIAAFVLTSIVCTEATPSITGLPEAISFQTRSLRGEVHETRLRRRGPVDGMNNAVNAGTSVEALSDGVDQATPSRKRKNEGSGEKPALTESGATGTRNQPSIGTSPAFRSQSGDQNADNAGKKSAFSPAVFSKSGSSSVSSQMSSLSSGRSMTSKKSPTRDQPNMGTSSILRRKNGQFDVNNQYIGIIGKPSMGTSSFLRRKNGQFDVNHQYNSARNHANVPTSFGNIGTSGMTSIKSSMKTGQTPGSTKRPGFDSRDTNNP